MPLMTLEQLQSELSELTKLRSKAVHSNSDLLWSVLDREKSRIEGHTIPWFYAEYLQVAECYCLVPRPVK